MKLECAIIFGLATWRVTSLFYREAGPMDVFVKIREWLGIEHDENQSPCVYPNRFFCKLFACYWCLSVWVAMILLGGYWVLPKITFQLATWLALSAIAIVIDDRL